MSEIKVNKISPRTACGTTTLGDSGDTFTIPAGVSITNSGTASGFGATGAVSWNTTVKTGDFTAVAGEGYFVNTTSGAITVTLPSSPSAGAVVGFKDYAKTWDTNNCILNRNSEKIGGSTNNATLSTEGLAVTLVYIDSTQGWLVTDDGLQSQADTNPFMVATGGTITCCGNFKIHTFTGPGTFTVCKTATCAANNVVDYLVVAGGGSGGMADIGGGGGAGGFRMSNDLCMPAPTTSPLANPTGITITATAFPITVGAGGAGTASPSSGAVSNSGGVSTFSTITSAGGGGGGAAGNPSPSPTNGGGLTGGSGGGAGYRCNTGAAGNTPPVSPSQGNNGGNSSPTPGAPSWGQGGGGGAGAVGGNGTTTAGGVGGIGSFVSPTMAGSNGTPGPVGSTRYFAGGGAGAVDNSTPGRAGALGGSGGGGRGFATDACQQATDGTANTGGGGGGSDEGNPGTPGKGSGAGGSGIVVIRYKFQ
jgi:hypothetical protein